MNFKIAPLSGSFMVLSILGFVLSVNIFNRYPSWAFSFMLVFMIMFVSSLISMAAAPIGSYDLRKEGIIGKNEKE